jgi:hypothetical protein
MELASMFERVERAVAEAATIDAGMTMVVDYCEARRPHSDWARLRALPYADLTPLEDYLRDVLADAPPPASVVGLWFGIFNPVIDDETVAGIYVGGADEYDPVEVDWAESLCWWPGLVANSGVLADIYRIADREGGLGSDAEYPLCLAYGGLAVRELMKRPVLTRELKLPGPVGVGVGFDSGDYLMLGTIQSEAD